MNATTFRAIALVTMVASVLSGQVTATSPGQTETQGLKRRADWGASFRGGAGAGDSGVVVSRLSASSAMAAAGIRDGDRILAVNGTAVPNARIFGRVSRALGAGDAVFLRAVRKAIVSQAPDTVSARFILAGVSLERIPGTSVTYGSVRSDRGYRLRTVVTRPERAAARRLPAILFIPWLSCDPVEKPEPGGDGFAHMLRDISAGSGMLVMRIEKPGVGDSEGPECSEGMLGDEVAGYRAALASLRAREDVDPSRIVLIGGSLGGGLAPILAAEDPRGIVGVVSVGGFTRTWYEHMLEIERARLTLSGQTPAQVNSGMRGFAQFYASYLIDKRTPAQVFAIHPHLRALWYDAPEHQYGRHARFFHAVQELDVEGAWSALADRGIPGLIVWGEYDWIMSRADQERAVQILNAKRPGLGTLSVIARADHGLMSFANMADAFSDAGGSYKGEAARIINAWLGIFRQ